MMLRNIDVIKTNQLKTLMEGPFYQNAAMKLVHLGAHPDTTDDKGNSLLHRLVANNANGRCDSTIEELVETYHAKIDIQNDAGLTPLQCLIGGRWYVEDAMKLVRLGASPNTTGDKGNSLLHRLAASNVNGQYDAAIKELVKTYHAKIDIQNDAGLTPLQCLIGGRWYVEDAMKLVRLGASPNTTGDKGNSLLHRLAASNVNGQYDAAIKELVKTYHAKIDIQNDAGLTPLQCLIGGRWYAKDAMKLVRLGADPDTKDSKGNSLLHRLIANNINGRYDAAIKELGKLSLIYFKEGHHLPRNNFLNLLILLAINRNNKESPSFFNYLPMELVLNIVSFMDFDSMGKTQQEGIHLAEKVFSEHENIKQMMATPGGINVFQKNDNKTNQPIFTFFKSAQTLCHDFAKLEKDLKATQSRKHHIWDKLKQKELSHTSQTKLNEFKNNYAIPYWGNHSSLYKDPANKRKLLDSIQDTKLYKDKEIKSQLKF